MTAPDWREEPISRAHDRQAFDCGDADMNTFLRRHARQNHDSGGSKTFCAVDAANSRKVLGFYSLAPVSLTHDRAPRAVTAGLSRHDVGGYLLARLATDLSVQGVGLGGQLLLAAGRRCLRAAEEAGGVMLLIDAKSDRAAAWYASYGAIPLDDAPLTLALPFATLRAALAGVG